MVLVACAPLDARLRLAIYRPTLAQTTQSLPSPTIQAYTIAGPEAGSRVSLWWWAQACAQAPALLYLHGTFRNLAGNAGKIAALHQAGFSVLALDYRGWGESSPTVPSQASIVADARLAWAELQRLQPMPARRVVYGHSMGSGVAVALASRLPQDALAGLILESAFTSFADVAREAGFWAGFLAQWTRERFESQAQIGTVRVPLLMLHGALDDTVPITLGQRLFDAANPPKRWVAFDGGHHSDLHEADGARYQQALRDFMRHALGITACPETAPGAVQH
ncbi:MAG: alpha/beta hydrolase [Rhodoferax sp.]